MEQILKGSYTVQLLLRRYEQMRRLKQDLVFRFGLWIMIDLGKFRKLIFIKKTPLHSILC